jgi:hypothetical protein
MEKDPSPITAVIKNNEKYVEPLYALKIRREFSFILTAV